jgi:hypothetical protein
MTQPVLKAGTALFPPELAFLLCVFLHTCDEIRIVSYYAYGLQLWGTVSNSNIEILERFQYLCMITDVPWYVTNALLRRDLHIPSVKEEIQQLSSQYST